VHLFTVVYHPEELAEHLARYGRYYFFANLFLHQRLLLKYARRALTEDAPMDVPWAEWGPLNTRFTYSPHQYRSLSGKRSDPTSLCTPNAIAVLTSYPRV
jgi:hypothetical protein